MSEDELVPIGISFNPFEAHVIRGKLESNDIPCFLYDENTFRAMSHLSLAISGIRVMVRSEDYNKAAEILDDKTIAEIPEGLLD